MSDGTKIEWAANADGTPGATWNPIVGCSVLSPGCTNCYAMREAARNERQIAAIGKESPYAGLTQPSKAGPVWSGKVRLVEHALTRPLSWKKPRTVFVNSMGDLFHDDVPEEWIDRVFASMSMRSAAQHTFIVLTKRASRMRDYIQSRSDSEASRADIHLWRDRIAHASPSLPPGRIALEIKWPLPNVWLGVSAEDQKRADERIPDLLQTPAAVRLVSAEPLLGPIDLRGIDRKTELGKEECLDALTGLKWTGKPSLRDGAFKEPWSAKLDWVIAGGESGQGARPMHPDWPRGMRDKCLAGDVPFFFKQWGTHAPSAILKADWNGEALLVWPNGRLGAHPWPDHHDTAILMKRVGKRAASRILDGRTHDDRPPLACERAA